MRPLLALAVAALAMPLLPALPAAPGEAWDPAPLGILEPGPTQEGGVPPPPFQVGDDVIVAVDRNQNEFSIAANPLDPDNLVAGANDYELGDAWAGTYASFDGGATWQHGRIPLPSVYTVSGDPAIVFDSQGAVYYAGIAFNRGTTNGGANAIFVSRSTDGGLSWTTFLPFSAPTNAVFHDKPYIGVDPASGDVLLTYTQFPGGIITFSKSIDGGASWSAKEILGTGQFSLPVAGNAGEIYVTWASGGAKFARSLDGGGTWTVSTPMAISMGAIPVGFRWFAYPILDVARGGPHAGRVYLGAPQQLAPGIASDLVLQHSDDGGATWSEPERLARPGVQFMPWMAIQPDGTLGIAYMDTVLAAHSWVSPPTGWPAPVPTLLVQSLSTKGPDDPAWFTSVTTDVPSLSTATTFWGDYQGLAATNAGFHPAFGDARDGDNCNCVVDAKLDLGTMQVSWGGLPVS